MNPRIANLPDEQIERVQRIIRAALTAADPRAAVARAVSLRGNQLMIGGQTIDLRDIQRIRVVGAGKASQAMARGLLDVLSDRLSGGVIITKHIDAQVELPERIRVLRGGHPVPTAESISSTRALVDELRGSTPAELIFCLISGGGSALMTLPVEGVSLEDMQALTKLLLASGADINAINTLRKHLDQVKGGGLARMASPAQVVSLILSDVIGSPLNVIASGPTVPDTSTHADALAVLDHAGILEHTPAAIRRVLETSATVEPPLRGVINHLVASNPQAAEAALAQARAEGFHTLLLTTSLQGEASQVGGVLASILRQIEQSGQPIPRPACIAAGGETTVTLHGAGRGGRNQELALGAAALLDRLPNVALVTLATDGEDGPTDAAGAVVTGETLRRARQSGLDPLAALQHNDSYTFFQSLGDLLITGPTGTNVNDLAFLFAF